MLIPLATTHLPKKSTAQQPIRLPSRIRISVGNSASRLLLAKKPSNGIIFCSAPTRPSVMTWARPFSEAATSSSKGFLKGSEHSSARTTAQNLQNITVTEMESEKNLKN